MKTFQSIQEERGEKAYKQAISMGLKYGGFGYWKDPQTNETVYKTENDTLVKVEPDPESELAAKGGPDGGAGRPDPMAGGAGGAGGGMTNAAGMLQMPGGQGIAGQGIQGAPMPGEEKVEKERGWEPGPDGDTCAGPDAEEPGKVPEDSFVGRTNFLKWQAGPDGDNMTTVSAGNVMEATGNLDWVMPGDIKPQKDMGFSDDTRGMKKRHKKFMDKMFGKSGLSKTGDKTGKLLKGKNRLGGGGSTDDSYDSADYSASVASGSMTDENDGGFKKTGIETNIKRADKAADIIAGRNRSSVGTGTKQLGGKALAKAMGVEPEPTFKGKKFKLPAPEQVEKKEEITKRMNDEFKKLGMVSQPDLDMEDIYENGEELGEGIQGRVMLNDAGDTVVKKGEIGAHELEALHRMKDHPNFPTMLNAKFEGPFRNDDPLKNNPEGKNPRIGKFYQDHNYGEGFYEKFPGAPGMFAMSAAKGEELHNVPFMDGDEQQHEMTKKIHQLRRDMHKQGIAHNDMHGGNMFYDEDSDELSMLDFGLSSVSPIRALLEGLGGLNDGVYGKGDFQLSDELKGRAMYDSSYDDTNDMGEMFSDNVDRIRQTLMDAMDIDPDDEDSITNASEGLERFLEGGIRMNKDEVYDLIESMPINRLPEEGEEGEFSNREMVPDDEFVMELIDMLYDGLEDTPLSKNATQLQRMARGHSDMMSKGDKKAIKLINQLRKRRGEGKLDVKGYDYEGSGDKEEEDRIPAQKRLFNKLIDHDD